MAPITPSKLQTSRPFFEPEYASVSTKIADVLHSVVSVEGLPGVMGARRIPRGFSRTGPGLRTLIVRFVSSHKLRSSSLACFLNLAHRDVRAAQFDNPNPRATINERAIGYHVVVNLVKQRATGWA